MHFKLETAQFIGIDVSKKRLHGAWLRDPQQALTRPKGVDNELLSNLVYSPQAASLSD